MNQALEVWSITHTIVDLAAIVGHAEQQQFSGNCAN